MSKNHSVNRKVGIHAANIVHKGTLPGKRDSVTGDTGSANENLPVEIKTSKSILEFIKAGSRAT
jgi:hypothetical protein